jgi:hypothetical protein
MFVNFEAGALEKRIKLKRGEGPPVSLTHRLNARAIASSPRSPRVTTPPRHLPPTPTCSTPCSALRYPRALVVPIHCRQWAVVEANPISPPREALLPASTRSVRVQRRPPMPLAIGDSTPRLRPRFNLHELHIGPAHLSDHSADFLDVCPSHSRRSPPPERPPSSSLPGTPPWAGRSGPPPASPSPPRARPGSTMFSRRGVSRADHGTEPPSTSPRRQGVATVETSFLVSPLSSASSNQSPTASLCSSTPPEPPRHRSSPDFGRSRPESPPVCLAPCSLFSSGWATCPSWPAHLDGLNWKAAQVQQYPVAFF